MTFVERKSYFFDAPGAENTADAARFSRERAEELGVKTVVVASSSGKTAQVFSEALKGSGIRLVVVTHVMGFHKTRGMGIFTKRRQRPAETGSDHHHRHPCALGA